MSIAYNNSQSDKRLKVKGELTTLELIASTLLEDVGSVVATSGYTTSGDGGGGKWKKTATTGTVSQSPAQLGDGVLNDGLGNQWALVILSVMDPRAYGVNGTNDLAAMQAAASSAGHLQLNSHIYIEGSLILNRAGFILSGGGPVKTLYGTHAVGAVIEVLNRKVVLRDFKIDSSGARLAANYNVLSPGILIGGGGRTSIPTNTIVSGMDCNSNPGDGVYFSGDSVGSTIEKSAIQNNRGHGIRLDDGTSWSDVTERPGTIGIKNNVIKNNGGNAISMRPEGGGSCYRIETINNDIGDNCWNETEIGYAVDSHIKSACQNGFFRQNAYNNQNYLVTTLNNGRTKYARAEPCSGIEFTVDSTNTACTSINDRILTAKYGFILSADNSDLRIDRPFAGGGTIDAYVSIPVSTKTMNNLYIDVPSVTATAPVLGGLDVHTEMKIGGVTYSDITGQRYSIGVKTTETIAGGGIRVNSNTTSVIGQGDVADTLGFIKVANSEEPLKDGDTIYLLNENAYNITISNSGAVPGDGLSPIKTKSGASVVLITGQVFTGVVIDGYLREV